MESLLFWLPSLFLSSLHVSKHLGHVCCVLEGVWKPHHIFEIFKFCTTLSLKPCFCRYDGLEVSPCLGVDVKHFLLTHFSGVSTVLFLFFSLWTSGVFECFPFLRVVSECLYILTVIDAQPVHKNIFSAGVKGILIFLSKMSLVFNFDQWNAQFG